MFVWHTTPGSTANILAQKSTKCTLWILTIIVNIEEGIVSSVGTSTSYHVRFVIPIQKFGNAYSTVYTLSEACSGVNWADLVAAHQGAFWTAFYDRSILRPKHRAYYRSGRPVIKIGPKAPRAQPWDPPNSLRSKPRTEYRYRYNNCKMTKGCLTIPIHCVSEFLQDL